MKAFSEKEYALISKAIEKAEKKTSAEIFAVLAKKSDDYFYIAMCHFSLWVFFVSCLLGAYIIYYDYSISLHIFLAAQLAAFLTGYVLFKLFPSLATMLAPIGIKHKRAHLNCINQFMAHGVHNTKGRSGVLIFVSLEERFGEVFVDETIEQELGQECWFDVVEALIEDCKNDKVSDGYINAINKSGELLATRFPRGRKKLNELEDKVVIL